MCVIRGLNWDSTYTKDDMVQLKNLSKLSLETRRDGNEFQLFGHYKGKF